MDRSRAKIKGDVPDGVNRCGNITGKNSGMEK